MQYRRALSSDYLGIVALQNKNLRAALTAPEQADGFLSVQFSEEQFQAMNHDLCVIVGVDQKAVRCYACASSLEFNQQVPLIVNMCEDLKKISYQKKRLSDYASFIYGPVCIDKAYRGKGILLNLFQEVLAFLRKEHSYLELLVTLIAKNNLRSLNAHKKLGLEMVGEFSFNENVFSILVFIIR